MAEISPFPYFKTSPEVNCLAVMLSLRNVEDLLHKRGIDIIHETVPYWWSWLDPMFASSIRRIWVQRLKSNSNCDGTWTRFT